MFAKAVLWYMAIVLVLNAILGSDSLSQPKPNNPDKVTYRWCKVGEDPKKDNCVDGSGSGG